MAAGIPFREERVVLLEADTWPDDDEPVTFRTIVRRIAHDSLQVQLDEPTTDIREAGALAPGAQLFGLYVDGDGVYSFSTAVLGHAHDDARVLVLEPPVEVSQLEPRRYPRLHVDLPVEVTVTSHHPPRSVGARLHDLSVSGARFATPEPLEAGQALDVRIALPGGEPVTVQGTIVETRLGRGDGTRWCHVGFCELDADTRRRLDEFTTATLGMRHRGSHLPRDPG